MKRSNESEAEIHGVNLNYRILWCWTKIDKVRLINASEVCANHTVAIKRAIHIVHGIPYHTIPYHNDTKINAYVNEFIIWHCMSVERPLENYPECREVKPPCWVSVSHLLLLLAFSYEFRLHRFHYHWNNQIIVCLVISCNYFSIRSNYVLYHLIFYVFVFPRCTSV